MKLRTYDQIIAPRSVRRLDGRTVKTCWIAEVKRELGLTRGHASTWGKGKGEPPCPPWAREAIVRCLYDEGR